MSRSDCTDVCEIVMTRLAQMELDVGANDEDHDKIIEALNRVTFVKDEEKKSHRKLTERERNRMVSIYASGPLTLDNEIDPALFELDLIQWYEEVKTGAVEAAHSTGFFFAKNGSVLPEWYTRTEKTWEMWTLSEDDIIDAARNYDKDLTGVDFDRVAEILKNKIAAAIGDQWDEYLADAIDETTEPSVREYQRSELKAMGGGDPNV